MTRKPNESDRAVERCRAAVASLAEARAASNEQQTERARNPRPFLEWRPEHMVAPLTVMRAEIAANEAARTINAADAEIATIKACLCAVLDGAADRYAAIEAAERSAPALDSVTTKALDAFVLASVARVDPEVARREHAAIARGVRRA